MNKINIFTFQNNEYLKLEKIIQYGFTIIENNLDSKSTNTNTNTNTNINLFESNIAINKIQYDDNSNYSINYSNGKYNKINYSNGNFNDFLFWYIPLESLFFDKLEIQPFSEKFYMEFEIIKKLPEFTKYIIVVDNYNVESYEQKYINDKVP